MGERICPYCGAHLDPEERCDCQEEEEEEKEQKIAPEILTRTGAISKGNT